MSLALARGLALVRRFAVVVAAALAAAGPASAQVVGWMEVGPTFVTDGQNTNISPSRITGAVRGIAVQPNNSDVIYAATVNGGIWKTTNGLAADPNWVPLTDNLPSLATGALQFDPTDPTFQTLVYSSGRYSADGRIGGARAGVYRTGNGGATWTSISGTATPVMTVRNLGSVLVRGATVLTGATSGAGLFRSTNTGSTWSQISGSGSSGLPSGSVFDIAGNANGSLMLTVNATGVYRSANSGATWALVNSAAMTTAYGGIAITANLALGPVTGSGQTVFASAITSSGLAGLFRSPDGGTTWTALDTTVGSTTLSTSNVHTCLVADPNNSNIAYIGGAAISASPFTALIFRMDAGQPTGSQGSLFENGDTANNSAPHSDTRVMVFDANGSVLMGSDGGIFRRTGTNQSGAGGATIAPGTGQWTSLAGNLRAVEVYSVAYDRVSHSVMTGQQDNGTTIMGPNTSIATPLALQTWPLLGSGGDGGDVAIDPLQAGSGLPATTSVRYYSSQNFGRGSRQTYDATNTIVSGTTTTLALRVTNSPTPGQALSAYLTDKGDGLPFVTPIAVNRVEGGRLYVGTNNRVLESTNRGDDLTDLSPAGLGASVVGIVAGGNFGGSAAANVLYVGAGAHVFARPAAAAALSAVSELSTYPTATSSMTVRALDEDTRDWHTVYALGSNRLFQGSVTDGLTSSWLNFSGNLATIGKDLEGAVDLESLAFVPVAGSATEGALVVGTDHGLYLSYDDDPTHTWKALSAGSFPNAYVKELTYDAGDDVLTAGTLGRGAWVLPAASVALAPVPEPASWALTGLGLTAVMAVRRRKMTESAVADPV